MRRFSILLLVTFSILLVSLVFNKTAYHICNNDEIAGSQILNQRGLPFSYYSHVEFTECLGSQGDLGRKEGSSFLLPSKLIRDFIIIYTTSFGGAVGIKLISQAKHKK